MTRAALLDEVIGHARQGLDAYGRGDMAAFRTHAAAAREANAQLKATEHHCTGCGAVYASPQECDWCPGRIAAPISNPAT